MPTEPEADPLARVSASGRAFKMRPMFVLVSVVVLAAASWVAWPRARRWNAERRAASDYARVVDCIGLAATTDDEALRVRAVAAELAGEDWPRRCHDTITNLSANARAARLVRPRCDGECCVDDGGCAALERVEIAAEQLASGLPAGMLHGAMDLRAAVVELGWPPSDVSVPTSTLRHWRRNDVPVLASHAVEHAALCRTSRDTTPWWLMLHDERKGATLCELGLPDPTARCHALPASVPVKGKLLLVDGGRAPAPRLFVGDGSWSVVDVAGKLVATLPAETVGVTTLPMGGVAALVESGGAYDVVVDGDARFTVPATAQPLLYGGYVIVQQGRELSGYAIDSGERVTLGTLASAARATLRGCVASEVTAIRVRDDERKGDVLIAQRGGTWSLVQLPEGVPPHTLSCHGATAHFTWIETVETGPEVGDAVRGSYRVHDVVCEAGVCGHHQGELELWRFAQQSRFFVASLGDDVAVIWRGPHGDVRAVIGPVDKLSSRAPVPVVEDTRHGGFAWDEAPMRLLSADNAAVFVFDSDGLRGVVIDGNGARPLSAPAR